MIAGGPCADPPVIGPKYHAAELEKKIGGDRQTKEANKVIIT